MMVNEKKIFIGILCLFFAVAMVAPGKASAADNLDGIMSDLNSRDWRVRLSAVENLANRKDERSLNVLRDVAGTRSEYWPVKTKAILLLGEAQDARAVELLLSIFNDTFSNWECPSIKSYTAIALGNFKGNRKVVDTLISGVNDRELLTREASIRSLGRIGDSRAVPQLVGLLGDRSTAIRLSAIKALGGIGDPLAIPQLQHIVESDSDPLIKGEASAALKDCRGREANN